MGNFWRTFVKRCDIWQNLYGHVIQGDQSSLAQGSLMLIRIRMDRELRSRHTVQGDAHHPTCQMTHLRQISSCWTDCILFLCNSPITPVIPDKLSYAAAVGYSLKHTETAVQPTLALTNSQHSKGILLTEWKLSERLFVSFNQTLCASKHASLQQHSSLPVKLQRTHNLTALSEYSLPLTAYCATTVRYVSRAPMSRPHKSSSTSPNDYCQRWGLNLLLDAFIGDKLSQGEGTAPSPSRLSLQRELNLCSIMLR